MFKLGTWVLAGYGGYMLYRQYIVKELKNKKELSSLANSKSNDENWILDTDD